MMTAGQAAQRISSLIWGSQNQRIDCQSEAGDKLKDVSGGIVFEARVMNLSLSLFF
jgi:hypothetical protein